MVTSWPGVGSSAPAVAVTGKVARVNDLRSGTTGGLFGGGAGSTPW